MPEAEPVTEAVAALKARISRLEKASWIERTLIAGLLFHERQAIVESGLIWVVAVILGFAVVFSIIERVRSR